MTEKPLKQTISEALWEVADSDDNICSATLTGSFLKHDSMSGLSDIDCVVIVDQLTEASFQSLKARFGAAVGQAVKQKGFEFHLNSTFGPLKFNRKNLVVLHLMVYSREGHCDHVIKSPFTCLDWQETGVHRKKSLRSIFPSFALQPHHFLSSRRSLSDYLRDYRKRVVSFRELNFEEGSRIELRREKPMDNRDRHEFAYHVVRFLMVNLLKLVRRRAYAGGIDQLIDDYSAIFPVDCEKAGRLLRELADKKSKIDYETSLYQLDDRLEAFVGCFESQFRQEFIEEATEHIYFRHAPTDLNVGEKRFVGRVDPSVLDACRHDVKTQQNLARLAEAVESLQPKAAYSSPLKRCCETFRILSETASHGALFDIQCDERLIEIDYGDCDGMLVAEGLNRFPQMLEGWKRGEDPCFPHGESSQDVRDRALDFLGNLSHSNCPSSLVCSHNVVLRSLVGELLAVPTEQQHLLNIPHAMPIRVISTPKWGCFLGLEADHLSEVMANFGSVEQNLNLKTSAKAA